MTHQHAGRPVTSRGEPVDVRAGPISFLAPAPGRIDVPQVPRALIDAELGPAGAGEGWRQPIREPRASALDARQPDQILRMQKDGLATSPPTSFLAWSLQLPRWASVSLGFRGQIERVEIHTPTDDKRRSLTSQHLTARGGPAALARIQLRYRQVSCPQVMLAGLGRRPGCSPGP